MSALARQSGPSPPEGAFRRELRRCWPIFKRMPAYARLAWALAWEPAIPLKHRLPLYSVPLYYVSPTHVPMSVIPVVGQLDGVALLLLALYQALSHCPADVARAHLARRGLVRKQFDGDCAVIRSIVMAAARAGGRRLRFAARVAAGFTVRVADRILDGE